MMVLDLATLTDQEAASLAGQVFAGESMLVRDVLARAAGNPLFLVQLLHHKTGAGGEALPQSIQSLIVARLDRLPERDRRIVQTASVLGQRFTQDEIDHLAEESGVALKPLIDAVLIRPRWTWIRIRACIGPRCDLWHLAEIAPSGCCM